MIKGENLTSIKDKNIALIIRLLYEKKQISRTDISKLTGLTQASITNTVSELMASGLIIETGLIAGEKGRRSISLELDGSKWHVIGLKISRTEVSAAVFDIKGKLYKSEIIKIHETNDPENSILSLCELLEKLLAKEEYNVIGVGLSLPGPLLPHEGKIILMTSFPGWSNINTKKRIGAVCESKGVPLFIEHDANCVGLAERWYGKRQSSKCTLLVLVSEGVGASLMINGEIYSGANGISSEIGHSSIDYRGSFCECGNRGCLEQYCSAVSIVKRYKDMCNNEEYENITFDEVFDYAKNGNKIAQEAFVQAGTYLGYGLTNIANILNPDTVILSDKVCQIGALFIDAVKKTAKKRLLPEIYKNLKICEGTDFNCDPLLLGAGALAFTNILQHPTKVFLKK